MQWVISQNAIQKNNENKIQEIVQEIPHEEGDSCIVRDHALIMTTRSGALQSLTNSNFIRQGDHEGSERGGSQSSTHSGTGRK